MRRSSKHAPCQVPHGPRDASKTPQRHALMQSMRQCNVSSCQHGLRCLLGSPFSRPSRRSVLGHLRLLFGCELWLGNGRVGQCRHGAVDLGFESIELVFNFVFVLVRHFVREEFADFLLRVSASMWLEAWGCDAPLDKPEPLRSRPATSPRSLCRPSPCVSP